MVFQQKCLLLMIIGFVNILFFIVNISKTGYVQCTGVPKQPQSRLSSRPRSAQDAGSQKSQNPGSTKKSEVSVVQDFLNVNNSDCCQKARSYKLEILCQLDFDEPELTKKCSCTDYMLCKMVVVTPISSNHFKESQDFFGSVYSNFPNTKIIVYNLGLKYSEVKTLESYCNVMEVRNYTFDKYPAHVRDLSHHAWKPFIFKEMSEEFELYLYCDASCRINSSFTSYLPRLLQYPILLHIPTKYDWSILRTTHESMIKYLVPHLNRKYLVDLLPHGFFESNAVLVWTTKYFREKILTPLIDCGMHQECISPKGSKMSPCHFKSKHRDSYAGCHREQSSFNLILMRELGPAIRKLYSNCGDKDFVEIIRHKTNFYDNTKSKSCGIQYM